MYLDNSLFAMEIPECPITKAPLKEPVSDPEGNTYEKSAILAWLSQHGTSPITRKPLTASQLAPNRALKDLIEAKEAASRMPVQPIQKTVSTVTEPINQADITFTVSNDEHHTVVSIRGNDAKLSYPSHICCVLDTSGSMGSEATVKDASGNVESDGLTYLDIVKHATRVIIESLDACDKLSLVEFNSDSRCVLPATTMDAEGKKKAQEALNALEPDGSTNLAAGIRHSIDLSSKVGRDYFTSIFVLTDGLPDAVDLDYSGAIRRQLGKSPVFGTISSFGFGYSLNSKLLKDIALEGDGIFGFIPDAGMVGTIFINALANTRTTYAVDGVLRIDSIKAAVVGDYRKVEEQEFTQIFLAPLRFGQSTEIVIEKPGVKVSFTCKTIGGKQIKFDQATNAALSKEESFYHVTRSRVFAALFHASVNQMFIENATTTRIKKHLEVTNEISTLRNSFAALDGLAKDLEGQVKQALSREDWFNKWGKHFFISLAFAHLRQVRNNFKDPGVQVYGGSLFKQLQEEYNDMFITLPPPKPSGQPNRGIYGGVTAGAPPPVNMTRYLNSRGVCFHGNTEVKLFDGSICALKELRKGIKLSNGALVKCLIITELSGPTELVELAQTLKITPYHPVQVNGLWAFPKDLAQPRLYDCGHVYNLVLESEHFVDIDDFKCVTIGHDFQDAIVKHEYFGSQKVVQDLERINGWKDGIVILREASVMRDEASGIVSQIISVKGK